MSASRFWSHVDKSGECWLWTGATFVSGRAKGQGLWHATTFEAPKLVHRLAYCLLNGVSYESMRGIPIKQTCGNPLCCLHVQPTTYSALALGIRSKDHAKESTYSYTPGYAGTGGLYSGSRAPYSYRSD